MKKIDKLLSILLLFTGIAAFDIKAAGKHTESKVEKTEIEEKKAEEKKEDLSPAEIEKATKLLWDAIRNSNIKQVVESLGKGADVNVRNRFGNTALAEAFEKGVFEIIQLLLDKIDINSPLNDLGNTALMLATMKGLTEVVKLLVKKGVDVNTVGIFGNTALMIASRNNDLEMVKLLIENGANVNTQNEKGDTALNRFFVLIQQPDEGFVDILPNFEIVKLLLENGAFVETEDLKIIEQNPELQTIYQEYKAKRKRS